LALSSNLYKIDIFGSMSSTDLINRSIGPLALSLLHGARYAKIGDKAIISKVLKKPRDNQGRPWIRAFSAEMRSFRITKAKDEGCAQMHSTENNTYFSVNIKALERII
jgi:hypothetical protein